MTSDLAVGLGLLVVSYLGLLAAVIHGKVQVERIARGEGPPAARRQGEPAASGDGTGESSGDE